MITRSIDPKEYVHDRLDAAFAQHLSEYDTMRRVEVLAGDFLKDVPLAGKRALDVGCGLGYFSQALVERGCQVTATDLGPNMVEQTRVRTGCEGIVADALNLEATFATDSFDLVISSECIEHTPDPARAVQQMVRMLKPGGLLSLSTPNLLWWPAVKLATSLRLRPFDGYENFTTWSSLRKTLQKAGADVMREKGVHLIPFHFRLHGLSRLCDEHAQFARGLMINMCVLARKR